MLTEAADYREQVDELPPAIPELSEDAERWLAAFATADEEGQEELWEECFAGELTTEIYSWITARTELLRPRVADLLATLEARGPSADVRAALLEMGGAWGV